MFERCVGKLFEDDYARRTDFRNEQQALIDALVGVQRSINKLEAKLKPLKANKKALTPQIIQILRELDSSGVRVGKILMFLKSEGIKDPTAKEIVSKAKEQLSKQFVTKLEVLVADLQVSKPEQLVIRTEAQLPEGFRGFMGRVKSMVFGLSSRLKAIERMFGLQMNESINESDADYKHTVPVELYIEGLDRTKYQITPMGEQVVEYTIEVESRSWGIKGIDISLRGGIDTIVQILDEAENIIKDLSIKIDFSSDNCTIEWIKGSGFAPESLEIHADSDGKVTECIAWFYYYDPTV